MRFGVFNQKDDLNNKFVQYNNVIVCIASNIDLN